MKKKALHAGFECMKEFTPKDRTLTADGTRWFHCKKCRRTISIPGQEGDILYSSWTILEREGERFASPPVLFPTRNQALEFCAPGVKPTKVEVRKS